MSESPTTRPKARKPAKPAGKRIPYAQLVKLAPKLKPPQSWYDETTNPFEPREKPAER